MFLQQQLEIIMRSFRIDPVTPTIPKTLSNPATAQSTETTRTADEPNREWKRSKPDFSNPTDTVTFYIGREAEPYIVHSDSACYYSLVLRAAFNSNFIEGEGTRRLITWMTLMLNHSESLFNGSIRRILISQLKVPIYSIG
ncbi:uncharacterized protein LY89DRAFT_461644 [Mollisia scopiformis]|uniref:Uncharacterized protein n=1 Tax=Mollisia scopiformis TaxID=149040 RepID=A0A194XI22_MOLSC|nr:uncharacterized protein LY89DRAFT_461644 [Mollisia scopiformis]KUJ19808.1 hypothetical protein LY89DRAFT_461644 [Mollisia scopiformis]